LRILPRFEVTMFEPNSALPAAACAAPVVVAALCRHERALDAAGCGVVALVVTLRRRSNTTFSRLAGGRFLTLSLVLAGSGCRVRVHHGRSWWAWLGNGSRGAFAPVILGTL